MDTKSKVLEFLLENNNKNISGEKIANDLNISRTSVWQSINKLKAIGHNIESNGNKGYSYIMSDIISPEGIRFYLPQDLKELEIKYYDSIDSTNKAAKIELTNNPPKRMVIVASNQTTGYGRYERNFFCSENGGVYISILLKSEFLNDSTAFITIKTAVALKRAVDTIANVDSKIKWVNDLFLDGKKIAGILTEGIINYETKDTSSIIVGTGINFAIDNFPDDLKNVAGSIFSEVESHKTRNELIGLFLKEFFILYREQDNKKIIEEYKSASFVIGKNISFVKDKIELFGKAIDINDKGELVVELPNKEIVSLFSGEVSIKIENKN